MMLHDTYTHTHCNTTSVIRNRRTNNKKEHDKKIQVIVFRDGCPSPGRFILLHALAWPKWSIKHTSPRIWLRFDAHPSHHALFTTSLTSYILHHKKQSMGYAILIIFAPKKRGIRFFSSPTCLTFLPLGRCMHFKVGCEARFTCKGSTTYHKITSIPKLQVGNGCIRALTNGLDGRAAAPVAAGGTTPSPRRHPLVVRWLRPVNKRDLSTSQDGKKKNTQ